MPTFDLSTALNVLNNQGVIAYPTEAVFGLGCDPDSQSALEKVLLIKKRPAHKGLILVAANIEQLENYTDFSMLSELQLTKIKASWPGPVTWIVPVNKKLCKLVSGDFNSVAVRVSAHPVIQSLCLAFGKPIVSTSANLSTLEPCKTTDQVKEMFKNQTLLETIVDASVTGLSAPSQIYDALSGKRLR